MIYQNIFMSCYAVTILFEQINFTNKFEMGEQLQLCHVFLGYISM